MSCPYGLPLGPRGFQRPKEPSVVAGDGSHHDDVGMDQIPVAGHLTGPVDVHLHHSPPLPGTDPQHGQCNKGRLIALGDPAFRNSEGQGQARAVVVLPNDPITQITRVRRASVRR